eukprot:761747-Hanusia_phi.AAC.1
MKLREQSDILSIHATSAVLCPSPPFAPADCSCQNALATLVGRQYAEWDASRRSEDCQEKLAGQIEAMEHRTRHLQEALEQASSPFLPLLSPFPQASCLVRARAGGEAAARAERQQLLADRSQLEEEVNVPWLCCRLTCRQVHKLQEESRRRRQAELRQEGRAAGLKEQIEVLEEKLLASVQRQQEEEKRREESELLMRLSMERRRELEVQLESVGAAVLLSAGRARSLIDKTEQLGEELERSRRDMQEVVEASRREREERKQLEALLAKLEEQLRVEVEKREAIEAQREAHVLSVAEERLKAQEVRAELEEARKETAESIVRFLSLEKAAALTEAQLRAQLRAEQEESARLRELNGSWEGLVKELKDEAEDAKVLRESLRQEEELKLQESARTRRFLSGWRQLEENVARCSGLLLQEIERLQSDVKCVEEGERRHEEARRRWKREEEELRISVDYADATVNNLNERVKELNATCVMLQDENLKLERQLGRMDETLALETARVTAMGVELERRERSLALAASKQESLEAVLSEERMRTEKVMQLHDSFTESLAGSLLDVEQMRKRLREAEEKTERLTDENQRLRDIFDQSEAKASRGRDGRGERRVEEEKEQKRRSGVEGKRRKPGCWRGRE